LSTSTPDQPEGQGIPDATQSTPAAAGGAAGGAAASGKPGGKFLAIAGAVALIVGVAGFFIGQSVTNSKYDVGKKDYNKIYAAGAAAGTSAGKQYGLSKGTRLGKQYGLEVGTKAGTAAGLKAGFTQGKDAGYKSGYAVGVPAGASGALGGLTGWNVNTPYVVELDPSPVSGVPYQVYSRTLMKAGYNYTLCPDGKSACTSPVPAPTPPS